MATAVLALQGAFAEHEARLAELGEKSFELRDADDLLRPFDRLVLPGGESTVQGKLLLELGMLDPIRERIRDGMPVLGTCAGLILLARRLEAHDDTHAPRFETLDVTVERNSYGRQLGSFHATEEVACVGADVPMTFIRAPKITRTGKGVDVLARVGSSPVAVRQGAQLGVAFHPELDDDLRMHRLFLSL
jgi:5'-phosphate synthase pdxT subunit